MRKQLPSSGHLDHQLIFPNLFDSHFFQSLIVCLFFSFNLIHIFCNTWEARQPFIFVDAALLFGDATKPTKKPSRNTTMSKANSKVDSVDFEYSDVPVVSFDSPFLPQSSIEDKQPLLEEQDVNTALIILNSPIQNPPSLIFEKLWNISRFRVCADGGANRLHDATATIVSGRNYVPDMIRGDLDSLRPDVESFYKELGTIIECDPNQDNTDLDKSLEAVRRWMATVSERGIDNDVKREALNCETKAKVYVYGAFGGRFDHEMSCIQALYKWATHFSRIILYNDESSAFLLPPKTLNEIRLPFFSGVSAGEGPTCGLIPLGCRCDNVKTTGLKWNLDGTTPLQFGGLVSTSNRVMEEVVTVQSSHPLVFTVEMKTAS